MYLLPRLCTTSRGVSKFEKFTIPTSWLRKYSAMVVEREASGNKGGFEQCTSQPYVLRVQSLLG